MLLGLFILASGVVVVQVVTNPLISLLGPQKTVHSRLTFAQAFNSLGTTIFPLAPCRAIVITIEADMAKEARSPTTGTNPSMGSRPNLKFVPGNLNWLSIILTMCSTHFSFSLRGVRV